jgi:hypothetical protein
VQVGNTFIAGTGKGAYDGGGGGVREIGQQGCG